MLGVMQVELSLFLQCCQSQNPCTHQQDPVLNTKGWQAHVLQKMMFSGPPVRPSSLFFLKHFIIYFFVGGIFFWFGVGRFGMYVPVKRRNTFSLCFLLCILNLPSKTDGGARKAYRQCHVPPLWLYRWSFADCSAGLSEWEYTFFWRENRLYGTRDCCSSWRLPQCPLEIQLLISDIKLTALRRVLQILRKDFEYLCIFLCLHVLGMDTASGSIYFLSKHFSSGYFCCSLFLWLLPMLISILFSIAIDVSESRISQKAFWLTTHQSSEYRCNIGGLRLCPFSNCNIFIHQYS